MIPLPMYVQSPLTADFSACAVSSGDFGSTISRSLFVSCSLLLLGLSTFSQPSPSDCGCDGPTLLNLTRGLLFHLWRRECHLFSMDLATWKIVEMETVQSQVGC